MTATNETTHSQDASLSLKDIDYLEFYVGNPRQAMYFYCKAFGFTPVAYAGLETGVGDRESFVMEQGAIRLVLTGALSPDTSITEHVQLHGDSLKDIAFRVDDATRVFSETVKRGAQPVMEPTSFEDQHGHLTKASIAAYGDTIHSFIQRDDYTGDFFPGYRKLQQQRPAAETGLVRIDHIAVGVESNELERWTEFYNKVFSFQQSHQEDFSTEYSAMNSKVVQDSAGRIKFPIVEPASGKHKSQIEEYLTFHKGPGAQHVALLTDDIIGTVDKLFANGIEFLHTPGAYYDQLADRVGMIAEDIAALREFGILVDRDESGYLLQVFTRHMQSRPTIFWEIIQRKGAQGFGGGNIRALFKAIEREQAARGNL